MPQSIVQCLEEIHRINTNALENNEDVTKGPPQVLAETWGVDEKDLTRATLRLSVDMLGEGQEPTPGRIAVAFIAGLCTGLRYAETNEAKEGVPSYDEN